MLNKRNLIFNPLGTKLRGSLNWRRGWLDGRAVISHIGGYQNDRITPVQNVESFTSVDFSFNVTPESNMLGGILDGSVTFGLDARNVFDQDPPYVNIAPAVNGGGGFDPSAVSPVGRVLGVSVRKRW
jgi:iron complex outermembrane receptor protein